MTVKVLLKRSVPEDKAEELRELIDQLRSATVGQPGYVAGETLRRIDKPGEFLVISKWRSLFAWQQWYDSEKRADIHSRIDQLLGSTTTFEVYGYD
jgi:heme-degrading monooxygenase HmoA